MTEIDRTRDVVVLLRSVTYTVAVNNAMLTAGWAGGQGVAWVESAQDEFLVGFSTGTRGAGFCLNGSNEDSDVLTSMTGNQITHRHVVVGAGSWVIVTRTYEHFTLASRLVPPLVPIIYNVRDRLLWSLRGLFTKEDEWTISGDPRAPNQNWVGNVIQAPSASNQNYLMIQTTL